MTYGQDSKPSFFLALKAMSHLYRNTKHRTSPSVSPSVSTFLCKVSVSLLLWNSIEFKKHWEHPWHLFCSWLHFCWILDMHCSSLPFDGSLPLSQLLHEKKLPISCLLKMSSIAAIALAIFWTSACSEIWLKPKLFIFSWP